jgi:ribosome-binding factor A
MVTRRQRRMNELLFEELSLLIPGRLDDPRVSGTQVTGVEVTQDLAVAKVYVTAGGDDAASAEMLTALEHAEGSLRTELGALGLPRLPRLVFARDRQFESGERVLALLDRLAGDEPAAGDGPASEAGAGGQDRERDEPPEPANGA